MYTSKSVQDQLGNKKTVTITMNKELAAQLADRTGGDAIKSEAMMLTTLQIIGSKYAGQYTKSLCIEPRNKQQACKELAFDDVSKQTAESIMRSIYETLEKDYVLFRYGVKAYFHIDQLNGTDTTLLLEVEHSESKITIHLTYTADQKTAVLLERAPSHYLHVLSQICGQPTLAFSEIELITAEEKEELKAFNHTELEIPKTRIVHEIFRETVRKYPGSPAVVFHPAESTKEKDAQLTYAHLDALTDQFAAVLRNHGIGRGSLVPIVVERNIYIVVGIYAIMKAGGAWVAIDPKFPVERKEFLLKDCNANVILTQDSLMESLEQFACLRIPLDLEPEDVVDLTVSNVNQPDDPALVIYTSGSTGTPKGSLLTHENLSYLYHREQAVYHVDNRNNSAEYAAFTFDISFHSLILHLMAGACVHILSDEFRYSLDDLEAYIETYAIDYMVLPTQVGESFIKQCDAPHLKALTVGGEKLRTYRKTAYKIINAYGPSECTVYTTQFEVTKPYENIPIGKPIYNNKVYIVDPQGHLCPVGMAGELCVSSRQLSKGYLNQPELTSKKFMKNPYDDTEGYERLYRSGDLAKWNPDGTVEFVGRADYQVKVRGYRIELGEVENAILKIDHIKDAVVIARENRTGNNYLTAYYIPSFPIKEEELIAALENMLPEYMIPSYFLEMDAFPLSQNGKVDRKAFPEITIQDSAYVKPKTELERMLAEIWAQALNVPAKEIGIQDNFFHIGGDSIKAIQVVSFARRNGCSIKVKDLFDCLTIERLAEKIRQAGERGLLHKIDQGQASGSFPLIPVQHWFFERAFEEPNYWNQSILMIADESIDVKRLEKAMAELIKKHDALRLRFHQSKDGTWLQEYVTEPAYTDLTIQEAAYTTKEELEQLKDAWQSQFDIEAGPIVSAGVIHGFRDQKDRIFMAIHHLVVDGISWRILLTDLEQLYHGNPAGEKTNSFQDWYQALVKYGQSRTLKKQAGYWERIDHAILRLGLPERNKNLAAKRRRYGCQVDREISENFLFTCNTAYNTQINDLLLTAFAGALCKWMQSGEVVINLEGHGREEISQEIDISDTVGWFTTQYPVQLILNSQDHIRDQIKSIKEQLHRIPDKGIGYGVLRYLSEDSVQLNQDCWVSFNYLGSFHTAEQRSEWKMEFEGNLDTVSPKNHDAGKLLDVNGWETEMGMYFSFDFNTQYFSEEDLRMITDAFLSQIETITNHCLSVATPVKTASDYGFSKLSQAELDAVLLEYGEDQIEDLYPVSPLQEGFLFHALRYPESDEYFVQIVYDIVGSVDHGLYKEAWNQAMQENSILRTAFHVQKSELLQVVKKEAELCVREHIVDSPYCVETLQEIRKTSRAEHFDLSSAQLTRLDLVYFHDRTTVILNQHHIINDGWGVAVLLKEVEENYQALKENRKIERQKNDYGSYIRTILNGDFYDTDWEFWNTEMQSLEELPQLQIFRDGYHVGQPIEEIEEIVLTLGKERYDQIFTAAKSYGVTTSDLMLAVWLQLLQEYSQSQFAGTAVTLSGREVPVDTIEDMVGLFINTVPVFADCLTGTIKDYLADIHRKVREINEHCHIGLSEIQKLAGSETALVNALYAYNHFQAHTAEIQDYTIQNERSYEKIEYPLCMMIEEQEEQIDLHLSYDQSAFHPELISHVSDHYLNILDQLCNHSLNALTDIAILTKPERETILSDFNHTKNDTYPTEQTFDQLFRQTAQRYPGRTSATFSPHETDQSYLKPQTYTYAQLDDRTDRLAFYLRSMGVDKGTIVPVIVDRNADIIVAALAIIKAGGAYLPIEATYPEKRIRYMVEESHANLVLTQSWVKFDTSIKSICLDQVVYENYARIERPMTEDSQSLMAILYTSGTTGNPKGIMLSHRNIINMAYNENHLNQISETDRVAVHASITFDPFLMMGIAPLLAGACVQIMPEGVRKSIDGIHDFLMRNQTTVTFLTTQLCELYAAEYENPCLKLLVTGGEKLFKCPERHYKIANGYGPTEDCVFATQFLVDRPYANIPIGKPMGNNQIYIINRKGQLCPVGIPGEICISSRQLSKGYLNQPGLTAKQFVPNPYYDGQDQDYERMYKTGDLGRWLSDGNIEILGRTDFQVKVRGYRIETDEIEKAFFHCPAIRDAIVVTRKDRFNRNYLIGYYVLEDESLQEADLQAYLQERLPEYMVPQYLLRVSALPMNANGKVDRSQLPVPEMKGTSGQLPQTEVEKRLAVVWSTILELKPDAIGREDSYFRLGGNSIKVILLSSAIRKEFDVEVTVMHLFQAKTIKAQANLIKQQMNTSAKKDAEIIRHLDLQDHYQLSNAQKRIYLAHKLREEKTAYNLPLMIELERSVDLLRLQEALNLVIEKQWSLRTYFQKNGEQLDQRIQKTVLCDLKAEPIYAADLKRIQKTFVQPFDLDHGGLLWRVKLFDIQDGDHYLLAFDFHHCMFDGTSRTLFLENFEQAYNQKQLEDLEIQYVDYAEWERAFVEQEGYAKQGEYWKRELSGELPVLNLPTDYQREAIRSYEAKTEYLKLEPELIKAIQLAAEKEGTTPFVVMLAAFSVLLAKYAAQEDILIGIPTLGRTHPALNAVIGMFVGTLPIRVSCDGKQTVYDLLYQTRDKVVGGLNNQMFSLEDMIEMLTLKRPSGHNTLFDVMFALWEQGSDQVSFGDAAGRQIPLEEQQAKYDLTFYVNLQEENAFLSAEYATDLFCAATMQRMLGHYQQILEQMLKEPAKQVKDLTLMTKQERMQLDQVFNATGLPLPDEQVCHEIFRQTAARCKNHTAVVYETATLGERKMGYQELNEKTDQFAAVLQQAGMKPGSIIPIMVERTADLIVGALAAMKAGAAWVAIDPKYPTERKKFLMEDVEATVLLTQSWLKDSIEFEPGQTICLDETPAERSALQAVEVGNTDPAVLVYTSGSTGKPKGSILTHANLVNFYYDELKQTQIQEGEKSAEYAAFTFDISLHTLLIHLLAGAEIHILSEETRYSLSALEQYVNRHKIKYLTLPTQVGEAFLLHCQANDLKQLTVAGEKLKRFIPQPYKVVNAYGPSEYTIYTTRYEITKAETNIPIGRPVANTKIYIVDKENHLCPIGVPGELWISGLQLSKGYRNRDELTAEKYRDNPFDTRDGYTRVYRTGDLAKWREDGNLIFVGRMDDQVKVRGFRIEPGEIESVMLHSASVDAALVVPRQDQAGNVYLIGYFTTNMKSDCRNALIKELESMLPDYMVPEFFVQLESFPKNANGKIDKRALPLPEKKEATKARPITFYEMEVSKLWGEVLHMDAALLRVEDNFFQLGGNSMKAMLLTARIKERLGFDFKIAQIFQHSTIRSQAEALEHTSKEQIHRFTEIVQQGEYPASNAQKRIYLASKLRGGTAYNLPVFLQCSKRISKDQLYAALQEILQAQATLRTYFTEIEGVVHQCIHDLVEIDLKEANIAKAQLDDALNAFIRPFILEKCPLWRAALYHIEGCEETVLAFDFHHSIMDGTSVNLFVESLCHFFAHTPVFKPDVQYMDFTAWEQTYQTTKEYEQQRSYWHNELSRELPTLELPTDFVRQEGRTHEGGRLHKNLDRHLLAGVHRIAETLHTTPFVVLLAAYQVMLSKYSRQKDLIVGIPTLGRQDLTLEKTMGMFVGTLPVRTAVENQQTAREYILQVRDKVIGALSHQEFPLEQMIEDLSIQPVTAHNTLFDVMFDIWDYGDDGWNFDAADVRYMDAGQMQAKYDLTCYLNESKESQALSITMEYDKGLFLPKTIECMMRHYCNLLEQIIVNTEQTVSSLKLVTQEEETTITGAFNTTSQEFSNLKPIHQYFEEQVERHPDKTAVIFCDEQLSYRTLNQRANQLARFLLANGVQKEDTVAMLFERSLDMVVVFLAILKAGAAYLPIDRHYPTDRIQYILSNSRTKLLLVQDGIELDLHFEGTAVTVNESLYTGETSNLNLDVAMDNSLYVFYTSGSTGNPKGVVIEHHCLANHLNWLQSHYPISPADIVMQQTTYTFDISVWELFWWTLQGATVCLLAPEGEKNPEILMQTIAKQEVTVIQFVPSMLGAFLEYLEPEDVTRSLSSIKRVFACGEALTLKQVNGFNDLFYDQTGATLHNLYGPTEATINVSVYDCSPYTMDGNVPIGKPISNLKLYVCDEALHLQPIGVPGELFISGAGVARGYLHQPELTAKTFVPNPFYAGTDPYYKRMYKTGDLVKWMPDGNLAFLGRMDFQVKVRGFRVELGEIENALQKIEEIKDSVVVTKTAANEETYLVAYFTATKSLDLDQLKVSLKKELPDYMVPELFMELESFPLTANGKIDRKALPTPQLAVREFALPHTGIETELAKIWADVLERDWQTISRFDNYFRLGGNSLRMIALSAKIRRQFYVSIPIPELFHSNLLERQAALIKQHLQGRQEADIVFPDQSVQEDYAVSTAQMRIYLASQLRDADTGYNVPLAFCAPADLDLDMLQETLQKLVEAQDMLRAHFIEVNHEIRQVIAKPYEIDLGQVCAVRESEIPDQLRAFIRPYDLKADRLWRWKICRMQEDNRYLILFDFHHSIFDGTSIEIFINVLKAGLNGEVIRSPEVQYTQYVAWEAQFMRTEAFQEQGRYWEKELEGELPVLELPTDYQRTAVRDFKGHTIQEQLEPTLAEQVKAMAITYDTTPFVISLAAFYVFLSKYSRQEDLIIGIPTIGRPYGELEDTIGMFVGTLPIRLHQSRDTRVSDLLQAVSDKVVNGLNHQASYPNIHDKKI